MKVKILKEEGHEEAALGFSLSWNSTVERANELLPLWAWKQGGENKFMESIYFWVDVTAPRFWWQEADTYRLSTKQSGSTMHTLTKRDLTQEDFEYPIPDTYLDYLNGIRRLLVDKNPDIHLEHFKNDLPEGFLQRRIWTLSYKTMQNIIAQRGQHRLPQWRYFIHCIVNSAKHPEYLVREL